MQMIKNNLTDLIKGKTTRCKTVNPNSANVFYMEEVNTISINE